MLNYNAICCKGIPELFLDKLVARQHFGQFGKITRFVLQPRRMTCTVTFETETEAERARLNGGLFRGHAFEIEYAELETNNVQNTEDWYNPEVQSELDVLNRSESRRTFNTSSIGKYLGIPAAKSTAKSTPAPTFGTFSLSTPLASTPSAFGNKAATQKLDQQLRTESSGQELRVIMRKPAYTAEEKYRALDARDKLVRINSAGKAKLVKAVATKGTCPDMCPEKERYMREFQRQVSSFEQLEGREQVICHKRAIKEYSRSSADQEAPLQHDLRTEAALHMTMSYLMHNIIDLCDDPDVSIGDWFHFVWDRTRSLRKDITQQELCSLDAVKLIEQCARFHIHCAARLVAEDPSVFDTKINAENLTKCLQTLKYMYHDLRLKNIDCASEPEFRGYIVLLNLRDANFLWEIKQLPIHIQSSDQVRRAIAFYKALQDNNFVRFFDMMRQPETSYMSACILLGYCYRLRVRAMEVLIKAHKWPKRDAYLPINMIAKSLGFKDKIAAKAFLVAHGLQCDANRVLVDRMEMPAGGYKMEREVYLVESKRKVKVGECICGEKLPPPDIFENHVPYNSFDENDMLKPDAWSAEDQLKNDFTTERNESNDKKPIEEEFKPTGLQGLTTLKRSSDSLFKVPQGMGSFALPKQQTQAPKASLFGNANIFGFNKTTTTTSTIMADTPTTMTSTNIFGNNQSSLFQPIGTGNESNTSLFGSWPKTPQTNIFGSTAMGFAELQVKAEKEAEELQRKKDEEKAARQRAEEEAQRQAEVEAARIREQERIAAEQAKEQRIRAEINLRLKRKAQRKAALEAKAENLCSSLLNSTINEEVIQALDEAVREWMSKERFYQKLSTSIYHDLLDDITTNEAIKTSINFHFDRSLLKRCFLLWREFNRKQREERRRFETTTFFSTEPIYKQAADINMHNYENTIALRRRYRQGEPCDFNKLMKQSSCASVEVTPKLDLWMLLAATLPTKQLNAQHYVKLLFTLPDDEEEMLGFKSKCEHWMKHFLVKGNHQQSNEIPEGAFINEVAHNVALCVRKVTGASPLNESGERAIKELEHCNGIVCFMTPQQLARTMIRLHNVRRSSKRLAIILFDGEATHEQDLTKVLGIDNMNFESFRIFGCQTSKSKFNFIQMLSNAVRFLGFQIKKSHNDNEDKKLKQQSLSAFTTVHLGDELWQRWNRSATHNPYFACSLRNAQVLVGLYNDAVSRLQSIATEEFQNVQLFPYDLKCHVPDVTLDLPRDLEHFVSDWHTKKNRRLLHKFFEGLKLPELSIFPDSSIDLGDVDNFEQSLYTWLLHYGDACFPDNEELSSKTSFKALQEFIVQMNRPDFSLLSLPEKLQTINYWSVLKPFAIQLLESMLAQDCPNRPTAVVYCCKKLQNYDKTPWWLNYKPVTEISFDNDNNNSSEWLSEEEAINRQLQIKQGHKEALEFIENNTDSIIKRFNKRKACMPSNINELTGSIDKRIKLTELKEEAFKKESVYKHEKENETNDDDVDVDVDEEQENNVSMKSDTNENATASSYSKFTNNFIDIQNMDTSNEAIQNALKRAENLLKRVYGI